MLPENTIFPQRCDLTPKSTLLCIKTENLYRACINRPEGILSLKPGLFWKKSDVQKSKSLSSRTGMAKRLGDISQLQQYSHPKSSLQASPRQVTSANGPEEREQTGSRTLSVFLRKVPAFSQKPQASLQASTLSSSLPSRRPLLLHLAYSLLIFLNQLGGTSAIGTLTKSNPFPPHQQ